MRWKFDRRVVQICLLAFLTLAAVLVFNKVLNASENLLHSIRNGLHFLMRALSPFFIAVVVAYILRPAVDSLEKLITLFWKSPRHKRMRQVIALALVYVLLLGMVGALVYFTIPQTVKNISDMVNEIPAYYRQLQAYFSDITQRYPLLKTQAVGDMLTRQFSQLQTDLLGYLDTIVSGIAGAVGNAVGRVVNAVLGVVLAFYLLNERHSISASFHRLFVARLGEKRSAGVYGVLRDIDNAFGRYISSRLLESVIVYVLAQIALSLMGVRFNVLFSVIVAVTNLIPYIGPVIGALPPLLVTVMDNPMLALYVGVVLLLLQALDAYVISPVLTGGKTGISPFWALFATLLGGNLFGIAGLLLAVPVSAVAAVFIRRYVTRKLEQSVTGAGKETSVPR
ncbi:MAG: AI-2E family transporter [Eubacteriales bacterium]|nr:AI-2E family transporter [Eubacteriales bacterium]